MSKNSDDDVSEIEDAILEAKEVAVQPVKNNAAIDPEEDPDDPKKDDGNELTEKPVDISKIRHTCQMPEVIELTRNGSLCTIRTPHKMSVNEIIPHYYQHYTERGVWDKIIPPTTEEDKVRIESFKCKICNQRFKASNKMNDPEPARKSFMYHWAVVHGKIIDEIQKDKEFDGETVLELLDKYVPDFRKFIQEGTESAFDTEPYTINNYHDYTLKKMVMEDGDKILPIYNQKVYLKCPFSDLDDCKTLERNTNRDALRIHLYEHYLPYWDLRVPKYADGTTEIKCKVEGCGKKITAIGKTQAMRKSMICHRALVHNELQRAIDDSIVEFDEDLYNRLFYPEKVKPTKIMYSFKSQQASASVMEGSTLKNGVPTKTFYPASTTSPSYGKIPMAELLNRRSSNGTNGSLTFKKRGPNPGSRSKHYAVNIDEYMPKKTPKSKAIRTPARRKRMQDDSSTTETDSDPDDPTPGVEKKELYSKRKKQKISLDDLDEDTDEDSDWDERKEQGKNGNRKKKIFASTSRSSVPARDLPKRNRKVIKTYDDGDSDVDDL